MALSDFIRYIPRSFVGLVLVATGIAKVLDIDGFVAVVMSYDLVPWATAEIIGYLLPVVEIVLGIWLLTGIQLLQSAWLAVATHVFYFSIAAISLWRGTVIPNCGCFGVFFARPLGVNTLFEDGFMIALAGLVVHQAINPRRRRLISHSVQV